MISATAGQGVLAQMQRARYLARQHGLALGIGLVSRALRTLAGRARRPPPQAIALLQRRFEELLRRDWDHAAAGVYPQRLLFHFPVREYAAALPLAIADLPKVVRRVRAGNFDDLPADIDRSRYPDYYLRNFHWQTDGWLSDRSARLYDFGVDLLFGGATDAMRRMTLPPVVQALRDQPDAAVLDVACGTGRFLVQMAAALPRARLHGVELSPFYAARAREQLAAAGVEDATIVSENAEQLPYADASFDAVTCVFLFHELPRDARRRVLHEIRRVLKPGGVVSVCDSAQLSDSPELAFFLDAFAESYHEPYYKGYVRDSLEAVLAECGFAHVKGEAHLVSKVVTARAAAS
jgi:ubiquinone/menaquinone biosynthesis C-methylase UbiE